MMFVLSPHYIITPLSSKVSTIPHNPSSVSSNNSKYSNNISPKYSLSLKQCLYNFCMISSLSIIPQHKTKLPKS